MSDRIDDLLSEFNENRQSLKSMIADLEKVKEGIDALFPQSFDLRFRRMFEEKVKTATEMFKALLDMRKELSKSLKDEIEIRRKLDSKEAEDFESNFNVRALAEEIEKMNRSLAADEAAEDKVVEDNRKKTLVSVEELTNPSADPLTILSEKG